MGATFLRLVQALGVVVPRDMLPTTLGPPPPEALAMGEELKDYYVSNFKGFV